MKKLTFSLVIAALVALPSLTYAREVTFSTVMKNYRGEGAYVALYLVDANGNYQQTLWVAGEKTKYYKHLSGWAMGSKLTAAEYDGHTGASVLSSKTLTVTVDIADEMIDAGYEVRVDTAVEDQRDNRSDAAVKLTTDGVGKTVAGRGYVQSLSYMFKP
ncbi:DUF2271 domain-containing protein [Rheinheimera sp. D18]|uniref:DUF2271 domain-containing protein n=1 Tax=Rheinheimera sp. D18 TaxID=2545632 RepID=UPI00104AD0D9|nr:DUF2271 domain-containing protein [Rheinheimera sp. D18]QBL10470.1 DUF2271 domain-containing protein [Rheinheimera sp. D18]